MGKNIGTGLLSREGQRQALWDSWIGLSNTENDFMNQQISFIFDALGKAVGEQILQDAVPLMKLGAFDEEVFTQCMALMGVYRGLMAAYEKNHTEITSPEARSILSGIYDVLSAQVKQFEDTSGEIAEGTNPVTEEKHAVFEKSVNYAAKHIQLDAGRFVTPSVQTETPDITFARLLEAIRDFCFPAIHSYYKDGLRFSLAGLNDLQERKSALYYTDLMESEAAVLHSIITIQVSALEAAVADNPTEKETVERILTLLKEGYQHFNRTAAALQEKLNDHSLVAEQYQTYENFEQKIMETITNAFAGGQIAFTLAERKTTFLEALDAETDALHDRLRLQFYKAAYDFQRLFSQELMLADEVVALFERARQGLPDADEIKKMLPPESAMIGDILAGVNETIEIKIESLRENADAFNEASVKIINDFTSGKRTLTPEVAQTSYETVRECWYKTMAQTPRPHVSEFFEICLSEDIFLDFYGYEKRITDFTIKIDKTLLGFKKETLLYEVCTYEEILIHSVSRLYDTGINEVDEAVIILDDTFKDLERLLKKNNIQIIRPEPHEPFNGREHEVLVAESQEGFIKGEIIKLVNSGYKQNEQIILRANVIAAK